MTTGAVVIIVLVSFAIGMLVGSGIARVRRDR